MKNHGGFSLVELIVTVMLMGLVMLTCAEVLTHTNRFMHRASVKQQLQSDADRAMNTIVHALQLAQRRSVVICSCGAAACCSNPGCTTTCTALPGTPPNSRIEFAPVGTSSTTAIYQLNDAILMQVGTTGAPMALAAQHVIGLMFSGDAQDLSRLYISLNLSVPVSPSQTETILIPNQAVRLSQ